MREHEPKSIETSTFRKEEGRSIYEYVLVASLTVVVGIIVLLALGKGM